MVDLGIGVGGDSLVLSAVVIVKSAILLYKTLGPIENTDLRACSVRFPLDFPRFT